MRYFLKKSTPSKKGLYLQIYQSCYVPGKGARNKSCKAVGYLSDLVAKGIPDPIKYAQGIVDELNKDIPNKQEQKIGDVSFKRNLGHFLLKSMWDYLGLGNDIDIMTSNRNSRFKMSDFILAMIGAQVVNPGSKHNAFEKVMPSLYGSRTFSYDQILALVKKKWTQAERLLVTSPIYSVQWLEVLVSSIVPCIGQELGNRVQTRASPC